MRDLSGMIFCQQFIERIIPCWFLHEVFWNSPGYCIDTCILRVCYMGKMDNERKRTITHCYTFSKEINFSIINLFQTASAICIFISITG